ncbi:hypothetical protein Aduo_012345 [Ancylostoma duodenale]
MHIAFFQEAHHRGMDAMSEGARRISEAALLVGPSRSSARSRSLSAIQAKIPIAVKEQAEAEVRGQTIVVSGLEKADSNLLPSEHQADVERKVTQVLDVMKVQCRPSDVFRIGRLNSSRPLLVKVVLPSSFHWRQALANARLLRVSCFQNVFVRRSMTIEERKREFDLRQQARELNQGKHDREWVVFRGELRKVSELSKKSGKL